MRKIFVLITLVIALMSCKNQDWSFPDYKYTSVYFPYQYPIRTLVLGEDIFDNSNDNAHKFWMSATMGGVYDNSKDINMSIIVDENLCNNAYFSDTKQIQVLPSSYYELSSNSNLIIPKGSETGHIEVFLKDAFFADPLAAEMNYVLPVRMLSVANADTILKGKASVANADPRILSDWELSPKDFTMFAIKYINPYHGHYLLRGEDVIKNDAGTQIDKVTYRQQYVEKNEVVLLETLSLTKTKYKGPVRKAAGNVGIFEAILTFSENGSCTISKSESSAYEVSGSGQFVTDGDKWGNEKRNVIFLSYQVKVGTETHFANDTLVVRDRGIVLEQFTPIIK